MKMYNYLKKLNACQQALDRYGHMSPGEIRKRMTWWDKEWYLSYVIRPMLARAKGAYVKTGACIYRGSLIEPKVRVNTGAVVENAILRSYSRIESGAHVGPNVEIGPWAHIGGGVRIAATTSFTIKIPHGKRLSVEHQMFQEAEQEINENVARRKQVR